MPVKIDNVSGLSYDEDVEFNEKELQEISLFNGYPVDTEVFPSSSEYIWTFYTGSSRIRFFPENDPDGYDFTQSITENSEWNPSGWYTGINTSTLFGDGYDLAGSRYIMRRYRVWQIENRFGAASGESANLDNLLAFLSGDTEETPPHDAASVFSFNLDLTSSIYNHYGLAGLGEHGWINGEEAVLTTHDSDENECEHKWKSWADISKGCAVGSQFKQYGTPVSHRGTPTLGTGPAGGVAFKNRSAFEGDSGEIIQAASNTYLSKDRFLHVEESVAGNNAFTVVRSPQRIFNNTPATTISRKFVGFYYHAYSVSNALETMANTQIYGENDDPYLITVWATPYPQTSMNTQDSFTHEGVTHDGPHLVRLLPGITLRAELQPPPTFVGGVKLSEIGDYISDAPDFYDRYWAEFPTSGSAWKRKVLEIPEEALEEKTSIRVRYSDGTSLGDGTSGTIKEKALYFYIVFGPCSAAESDIAICQFQTAEYDSALVPQSILDQLE